MVDHDEGQARNDAAPTLSPAKLALVAVLLAAPLVGLLWVSSYAKKGPSLFGFPFFYWYQFLWVFLAATCTSIAYQVVVIHERQRRAHRDAGRGGTRGTSARREDEEPGR